jgi:hypothetical protein
LCREDKHIGAPGLQITIVVCRGSGVGPLRIPEDKPNSLSTKHGQGMLVHLGAGSSIICLLLLRVAQASASHGKEWVTKERKVNYSRVWIR